MSTYISKFSGEQVTLGVVLTSNGAPVSGQTPTLEFRRTSDDKYFDFSAVISPFWISVGGTKEGLLVETSYQQGFYAYVFDHALHGEDENEFRVIYRNPNPFPLLIVEVVGFSDGPLGPANPYINVTGDHTEESDNVLPDGTTHGSCD